MFHWVRGIPFEFNAGAYDNLNMWEQIDNGDQYTPAKKFLLSVPVVLFLLSTHYTHYDMTYFTINFLATLGVVIPKLPFVRLQIITGWIGCFANFLSTVASPADRSILRDTRGVIKPPIFPFFFFFPIAIHVGVFSASLISQPFSPPSPGPLHCELD
jgi:hypothetical protein